MEWIKNMSLKKSLFTLTLINLLLALSLSAVVFVGCTKLSAVFAPSGVQIIVGADSTIKTEFPEPVAGATAVRNALVIFSVRFADAILHCRFDINCISVLSL